MHLETILSPPKLRSKKISLIFLPENIRLRPVARIRMTPVFGLRGPLLQSLPQRFVGLPFSSMGQIVPVLLGLRSCSGLICALSETLFWAYQAITAHI